MAAGPGKYDDLCTYVREKVHARGAVVIVIDGDRGDGMSQQITGGVFLNAQEFEVQAEEEILAKLPKVLRYIADTIEQQGIPGIRARSKVEPNI